MTIRRLPTLLVNQIAAGEVIERPASVVKELVENALDAGAMRVEVAVEGGGADLVRVADDGAGIPADELPLAVAPHATSKLREAADLEAVATLGFRGEALASIASVSRLRIASRATRGERPDEAGAAMEAAGDDVGDVRPSAMAAGTTVEVRDLFFNTPARRKFLRTPATEFGHVHESLQRIALTHPQVAFTLSHGGRAVLDLAGETGEEGWRRRAVAVLGPELEEALLAFAGGEGAGLVDERMRGWSVRGLAGRPSVARSNGKAMHLCVNGRCVRDRNLQHAVKEAYRGLMPGDRFPLAAVFVAVPPREVDVNVHPAKAEVRFREPSRVHGLVHAAVRQRLLRSDLTPGAVGSGGSGGDGADWKLRGGESGVSSFDFRGGGGGGGGEGGGGGGEGGEGGEGGGGAASSSAFVDYFRRMDPTQKGFVFQEVKRALQEDARAAVPDASLEDSLSVGVEASGLRAQSILQVHDSYVVTQDEQGLLIVDQHALHERVMFEELRRRILGEGGEDGGESKSLESQRLLMPVTLAASASRQALLEDLGPLLARIGVEAEAFGKDRVAIHAFPSLLFDRGVEPAALLGELLDAAEAGELDASQLGRDGGQIEEAALHRVLDLMACKAAVKAGDRLRPEELAALLQQRERVERSSSCPHGRPTTLRLSLKDLAKQFGRT